MDTKEKAEIILSAENINKTFGTETNKTTVLKNVSIVLGKGEFAAVIGKSGSGKSTLLQVLSGILSPDAKSGNIILDGNYVDKMSNHEKTMLRRNKVGFVFQSIDLLPELTVVENIRLPLYFDTAPIDDEYIFYLISSLGLNDLINRFPFQISGGQQQRVAIARAFAAKPAIIFADEPTGNLDSVTSEEVMRFFIESVKTFHQTILLVTHNLELARSAGRILTLHDGQITAERRAEK